MIQATIIFWPDYCPDYCNRLPNSSSGLTFVFTEWQSDSLKYESAVTLLPTALQWLPISELSQHSYEWGSHSSTGMTGDHSPLLLLPSMPRKRAPFSNPHKGAPWAGSSLDFKALYPTWSLASSLSSLPFSFPSSSTGLLPVLQTYCPALRPLDLLLSLSQPLFSQESTWPFFFFSDFCSVTLSARAFLFPDLMPYIK